MTRELTIVGRCDICQAPAPHMETMTLEDMPAHEIDLCDEHWKSLTLAELRSALTEHGRLVKKPAAAESDRRLIKNPQGCPVCDSIFRNRAGLASHMRSAHQMSLTVYETPGAGKDCPICRRQFSAQGLPMHMTKMHPEASLSDK